jgi:5-formyltetrahydrofolate cyclo-ligase
MENMSKNDYRALMTSMRDALEHTQKSDYDKSIFNRLINCDFYNDANIIFTYVSFKSEVDTIKIIDHSLSLGKLICVPKINKHTKSMEVYRIKGFEDLDKGYFGILEPNEDCREVPADNIDLILLPGLAFDRSGTRIGYGRGFYDRYLTKCKAYVPKIALSYDFQVASKLPSNEFDIKVDAIITNKEIILINGSAKL